LISDGGEAMKFLLAPWGNPERWGEVTYEFDGRNVKSHTSLKILQESISPDRTIIIGLDTLAEKGRNYGEVRENAEEKIKKYTEKFGLEDYEVLIAPGTGTFPNGKFDGDVLDYYYYIIAKISLILLEDAGDIIDLHLDLTHGINYSPILTYKAIREIAEIFSMLREVKFKAYNADPFVPSVSDRLSVNIVEDIHPVPRPFAEKFSDGRPLEPRNFSREEKMRFYKEELNCIREINTHEVSAFIGALYNGLPLALFRFYPDMDKLGRIISVVLDTYEKYAEVRTQKGLEVVKRVRMKKDFKAYVFAYVTTALLKNLPLEPEFSERKEVALDEIEAVKEGLFKFDERFHNRIANDIYQLKKDLGEKEIKNWKIYNEILERSIGEVDKRNFLAHSGFERNVVEVKKQDNRLMLRYREDNIETIAELCQTGLK